MDAAIIAKALGALILLGIGFAAGYAYAVGAFERMRKPPP